MKKIVILFTIISCLSASMERPPSSSYSMARVHSALELLQTFDLDSYNAIGCYDHDSEEIMRELKKNVRYQQLCAFDPNTHQTHKCFEGQFVPISLIARLLYSFWYDIPKMPHQEHDLIFSSFAFLFNPSRQSTLDLLHAHLKPGGHLVIRGFAAPSPYDPIQLTIRNLAQQKKWEAELKEFELNKYEFSFTQAKTFFPADKWVKVSTQCAAARVTFASNNAVHRWVSLWLNEFPFNKNLSKPKKQELAMDFTQEYMLHAGMKFTSVNILIEAYKK